MGCEGRTLECSTVFKYGMKRDFNAWLASLGPASPMKTLTALREWNLAHRAEGALKYGQAQLDISDEVDLERDRVRYLADRAADVQADRRGRHRRGHEARAARCTAVFAGSIGAAVAAKPGYPTVIVPFGFAPNAPQPPFPAGFDARPSPLGISFTGGACSEPRLIEIAYAFEQATKRRAAPGDFP